jgi:hypothetical protein
MRRLRSLDFSRKDSAATVGIIILTSVLVIGAATGLLQASEIASAAAYVLVAGIATCAGIIIAPRILRTEKIEEGKDRTTFPELMNRLKQTDELNELKQQERAHAQLSRLVARLIRDGRPSMLQHITSPPTRATLRVLETAFNGVEKFLEENASVIDATISNQWDQACQPIMKHYGGAYVEYDLDLTNLRALADANEERLQALRTGELHNPFCTNVQRAQAQGVRHYGIPKNATDCQCACHK